MDESDLDWKRREERESNIQQDSLIVKSERGEWRSEGEKEKEVAINSH